VFINKNLLFLGETGKYLRQFEGITHFYVVFWFLRTPDLSGFIIAVPEKFPSKT